MRMLSNNGMTLFVMYLVVYGVFHASQKIREVPPRNISCLILLAIVALLCLGVSMIL